ncbi:VOC family protein [Elioraea sp.]|uniref:VOC family protein n=1 Tax=Elioraea sp. TaxID=2185103 RepID=UPI003F719BE8
MSGIRIDHLHIKSREPEAAAAFYVRAFGARETGRQSVPAGVRIVLDLDGLALFVESVPEGTPGVPAAPYRGLEHLGLAVDDLDALLADLASKGIALEAPPSSPRPGVRIAFVKAPDGARVEILERK